MEGPGSPPTASFSRWGLLSILFAHLALAALIAWLWLRSELLHVWFVLPIVGFLLALGGLFLEDRRAERDHTTTYLGMTLNLLPMVLFLVLRRATG